MSDRSPREDRDDRDAVREVLVRYATGLDRRDYDLVATCFAGDARCEYDGEPVNGVAELLPYLRERLDLLLSTHHYVTNAVIEVNGDVARSECYTMAVLLRNSGEGVEALMRGLRYIDDLHRDGDRWLITARRHVPQWMVTMPAELLGGLPT